MSGANDMQRYQTTGDMYRTSSGTVHRVNKLLRAPRSGKSYDYLSSDDMTSQPTTRFNYMRSELPSRNSSKSFDYLDGDQNRDDPREAARRFFSHSADNVRAGPRRGAPPQQGAPRLPGRFYSESSQGTASSEDEEEREDDAAVKALLEVIQDQLTGRSTVEPLRMAHGTPIAAPAIGGRGANAGTVALISVGFCNILLNLFNTQKYTLSTPIPAAAVMLGGGAQFIAGLLEFTKGNSFGSNSFMSYGAFWLTISCRWMIPNNSFGGPVAVYPTTDYFEGIFLQLFAIHSLMMTICTFRMNLATFFVFLAVMLTYFLTGLGNMLKKDTLTVLEVGGYFGIVSGAFSYYVGFAELINEVYDRTILPVIPVSQLPCFKKAEEEDKDNWHEDESPDALRNANHDSDDDNIVSKPASSREQPHTEENHSPVTVDVRQPPASANNEPASPNFDVRTK